MTVAIAVLALVLPAKADHCQTAACGRRAERQTADYRLRHRCSRSVPACIERAARLHHVSAGWMRSIAWCESRLDPRASNGTHFGLFQFDRQTWASSPYARRGSVWSAKWSSLATAWYIRHGQASRWACA